MVTKVKPNNVGEFRKSFSRRYGNIFETLYLNNRHIINIKNQRLAVPNLQNIVEATLCISNKTGFHSMSLRDLSKATGISMGALYTYIDSKEMLLSMILEHVYAMLQQVLGDAPACITDPREKLRWILRTHIYLTDVMQPWFFFAYTEAKSFNKEGRKASIQNELLTEKLILECLETGQAQGRFVDCDTELTASLVKPLLQDWYLKQWKYRRRRISPNVYADRVIAFVESYICSDSPGNTGDTEIRATA